MVRRLKAEHFWALLIFGVALIVRLVYFYQVKANFPGWDSPTIDPLYHDLWAKQIASGNILGAGPFFRAPFYAYLLGLIYSVFGPSLEAAKIIQHVIGALTCSVIFIFADRYFGRRAALTAGLISVFNWVLIYHEDELLLDSLLVLFSVSLIWTLMRAAETGSGRRFFVSGLVLGLACITRPNYLAFLPVVLLWLLALGKKEWRPAVRSFGLFTAGAAILILPVTARNYIVGHDKVLIASQGGINFYIGNNPQADGASAIMPEFGATWQYSDAEYLAKAESGRAGKEMKQSEVSSFYYRKGLEFVREQPLAWIGLTLKKLTLFWNSFEISNNENLYFFRQFASITKILPPLFFIISPLSLLGLYFVLRMGQNHRLIGYFIVIYMLTVAAFFVNSRFRLPVLPLLIILASMAFWKSIDYLRNGSPKAKTTLLAGLAALFIITYVDFYGVSNESFAMSHFSLGNVYLKKGLKEKALEEYAKATGMAGCVPKAHLNRGVIYFSQSDNERAEAEFKLEIEKCRNSAEAHNNLSVLERLRGNHRQAYLHAREAVLLRPQYLEARVNEILVLRLLADTSEAFTAAQTLIEMFPEYAPGRYLMGQLLSERRRISEAEREFRAILTSEPVDVVERYDLSTIYAAQTGYGLRPERMQGMANFELGLLEVTKGRPEAALPYFKATTEILPDFADGWSNLALAYDHKGMYGEALQSFGKAIELEPTNPVTYYNCGLTLGKTGRLSDALQFFRQALDLKPDFPEAAEKLRLTESIINSAGQK